MPDSTIEQRIEQRVDQLVTSPAGCALLLIAEENNLAPADLIRPEVALWITGDALETIVPWTGDHDWVVSTALSHGPRLRRLAHEIVSSSGTSWWWEPLRRDAQLWTTQANYEPFPSPDAFPTPRIPPSENERYTQHSDHYIYTSTSRAGLSSLIAAMGTSVNDWHIDLPAACKRVEVREDARVIEIDSARDWHELVRHYFADGSHHAHPDFTDTPWGVSDGMVPDWSAIARVWDGVHISLWASVTAEQVRIASDIGWTERWGTNGEHTLWLNWAFCEVTDLPDIESLTYPGGIVMPQTLSRHHRS